MSGLCRLYGRLLGRLSGWLRLALWGCTMAPTTAVAQEVHSTDLTGYWISNSGVKVFIPVMRDGKMPIVLMNKKPTVLLGDWDWQSQTLKVNNTRFGIADGRLTMTNRNTTQTHTLKRSVPTHPSDGIWFHEREGELLVVDDGKKLWTILIPPSQEATIQKAKWIEFERTVRIKLNGRCNLDFQYEPDLPDLIWMLCPDYEHDWVRIHRPNPFYTTDWSGTWTSDSDWTLYVDMDGQGFGKVYIESPKRIVDFQASWIGGSQGHSILLERRKESNAIAMVDPADPNSLLMRIDGTEIKFTR